jgi:carbon-monoxide dehydrogenase large subunit
MNEDMSASVLDRPNSYIGKRVARPNARRLLEGRGKYTGDVFIPGMLHVAFFRSPYAHAKILSIDLDDAKAATGVIAVVTGEEIEKVCKPWVGVLDHFVGMKSAVQHALAIGKVHWQGEPLVAVVAESRREAEDALDLIYVDWEELPAITNMESALEKTTLPIHDELGDNLAFNLEIEGGDIEKAFADADVIVEDTFKFGRHTVVSIEPRTLVADYNPADQHLTVHASTQTPYQMQDVLSRHLNLSEEKVRIIAGDIGGSFGLKLHVYGDEMATCALSLLLKKPVQFIADRMESFQSDIHARHHRVKISAALKSDGEILGMRVNDLTGIGPYSVYPRTSATEGNQVIRLIGGAYKFRSYHGTLNVVFQNKNVTCQYRGVGHPIACAATEGIIDKAADRLGMDPIELRRKNYVTSDMYPHTTPTGYVLENLSHQACTDQLVEKIKYKELRHEQENFRKKGVYRGIGFASLIEISNPGPAFYGVGGARISSQDGCTMKLEPSGKVQCALSVNELGQGTHTIMGQVAATELGMPFTHIHIVTGDTAITPNGGAAWASRGAGLGSDVVIKTARALRESILDIASHILDKPRDTLDIQNGDIVIQASGESLIPVSEVSRIAYYRTDTLPQNFHPQLTISRHHVPQGNPFAFTNGIHASYVEVDVETGFTKLLKHWVIEDCGTPLNPMLVEEQIRGGVVQGIGAALFEECIYDDDGQLLNGNMADYMVPLASDVPDIYVGHVVTPTEFNETGAKGCGEAGTTGATAAIMNAINDAIKPFKARITQTPCTPERVLRALGGV